MPRADRGTPGSWYPIPVRCRLSLYFAIGEPLDKAGAYAVRGRAAAYIERIKGSYSNVVGLPLHALCVLAEQAGVKL